MGRNRPPDPWILQVKDRLTLTGEKAGLLATSLPEIKQPVMTTAFPAATPGPKGTPVPASGQQAPTWQATPVATTGPQPTSSLPFGMSLPEPYDRLIQCGRDVCCATLVAVDITGDPTSCCGSRYREQPNRDIGTITEHWRAADGPHQPGCWALLHSRIPGAGSVFPNECGTSEPAACE